LPDFVLETIDQNSKLKGYIQTKITKFVEQLEAASADVKKKKQLQLDLANQIRDDGLNDNFDSPLDFFSYVLEMIVGATTTNNMGIIISNFYLPSTVLYFPYDDSIKSKIKTKNGFAFVVDPKENFTIPFTL
jgi:hypothetical protein